MAYFQLPYGTNFIQKMVHLMFKGTFKQSVS
jgi:hypothetical protein